jgi:hypothetical protein
LENDTLTLNERWHLQWQLDRMDLTGATLIDAARVFDELEAEQD